jgi:hypothetical protein
MRRPLALVALALGVAVAGCGSSGSTNIQQGPNGKTVETGIAVGAGPKTESMHAKFPTTTTPESKESPSPTEPQVAQPESNEAGTGGTPPESHAEQGQQGGTPAP